MKLGGVTASLLVVFVLDRSGSMGTKTQGEEKLAIAKRATLSSIELMNRLDRVGVGAVESRGIIENGRLSRYGKLVEALPVDRPWAELIVNAEDDLIPYLAVMSSIESLHRMTREERNLEGHPKDVMEYIRIAREMASGPAAS